MTYLCSLFNGPQVPWVKLNPYIERARNGDPDALAVVVCSSAALILERVRGYPGDQDHWTAIAVSAIQRAVRTFDPARGPWSNYAPFCIRGALRAHIQSERNRRRRERREVRPSHVDLADTADSRGIFQRLRVLTPTEERLLTMRYQGATLREAARALGKTRLEVRVLESRALRVLRDRFNPP